MNVNQTVLNITIPTKLLSWYKQFVISANKVLEEEEKGYLNQKETIIA